MDTYDKSFCLKTEGHQDLRVRGLHGKMLGFATESRVGSGHEAASLQFPAGPSDARPEL